MTTESQTSVKVSCEGANVSIHIPMKFKRKSGRKEVIVPQGVGESAEQPQRSTQPPLLLALARAHRWQKLLDDGAYGGVSDLARAFKVDASYVGRILRLTLLAPDIIQAILEGREPNGLSLNRLVTRFPLDWRKQRRWFGMGEDGVGITTR